MEPKHIVYYQLLNDYSGSPKALLSVIEKSLSEGHRVDLYTSAGGPLDALRHPRLKRHTIPYRFTPNRTLTALRFIGAQIAGFLSAFRYAFSRDTEFYVNTILPVGAALGARLTGHRLTVHCHEDTVSKSRLYTLLSRISLPLAHRVICVSEYQAARLPAGLPVEVRRNTLPSAFLNNIHPDPEAAFARRNVLMLASLKPYKGIADFVRLAAEMPGYEFTLVVSDTTEAINRKIAEAGLVPAPNLTIHPCSADVTEFYNRASIVVNLSNPDLFVETCGLTALEARAALLPVIVPTVGGIADVITEGVDGFHVDCHDTQALRGTITRLLTDRELYIRLANGSREV